ncbi:MAG: hypothetical protein JHC74_07585 [Thermoleophilia bacterium]|nr:hypothetical protein [Thermoleophilia bacterium]
MAAALGAAGAALGVAAGLVQIVVGPDIRDWVGDKQDTTRLGLATLVLSLVALTAAGLLARHPDANGPGRLLAAAGLLIPAGICFTTVGRLWYAPGVLLIVAGALVLAGLRGEGEEVRRSIARHWLTGLTVVLGVYYVFLGAVALGPAGALGIVGGLLMVIAVLVAARGRTVLGATMLVVGAVPFALLTWWSVVTPLIAVLALVIGGLAVGGKQAHGDRGPEAARG